MDSGSPEVLCTASLEETWMVCHRKRSDEPPKNTKYRLLLPQPSAESRSYFIYFLHSLHVAKSFSRLISQYLLNEEMTVRINKHKSHILCMPLSVPNFSSY